MFDCDLSNLKVMFFVWFQIEFVWFEFNFYGKFKKSGEDYGCLNYDKEIKKHKLLESSKR